jgi:hypothetical protein
VDQASVACPHANNAPAVLPVAWGPARLACMQVERASDIANAERLVFPGVGAFGQAMKILQERGYTEALKDYIKVRRSSWRRQAAWVADLEARLGLGSPGRRSSHSGCMLQRGSLPCREWQGPVESGKGRNEGAQPAFLARTV